MNPYTYVKDATEHGETLLSLCCGIGLELQGINASHIVGVDVVPEYLARLNIDTVLSDALEYTKEQPSKSFDVISIIDGIEHMDKKTGLKLIKEMKRVAKGEILLFTPQAPDGGIVKNEPHAAWGIEAGDEHQVHISGWTQSELEDLGFDLLAKEDSISQHDEPYTQLMMIYRV